MLPEEKKLIIVQLINEKKEILFRKFNLTAGITYDSKRAAWQSIVETCRVEYGFSPVSEGGSDKMKDWEKVRKTWDEWKRATIAKRDKKEKTGGEGGIDAMFTEFEKAVLDVIGRDSAQVQGLNVRQQWADSWETPFRNSSNVVGDISSTRASADRFPGSSDAAVPRRLSLDDGQTSATFDTLRPLASDPPLAMTAKPRKAAKRKSIEREHEPSEDACHLQYELYRAQIDYLKVKTELLKLELDAKKRALLPGFTLL